MLIEKCSNRLVAQGPAHLKQVVEPLDQAGSEVPAGGKEIVQLCLDQIDVLAGKIEELRRRLRCGPRNTERPTAVRAEAFRAT
ncbi:MAG: hypothetical protein HC900_03730 [Methylacidiphilales bacterium]|nr:hypothetical protein [Candidatus Methylacidiphilales bacterium]